MVGGAGTGTASPGSSSGASTSEGVAIRAGARAATCSLIAADTICSIAPNRAGDISSADVSEEVLCLGGSAVGPTTRGRGVACVKVAAGGPVAARVGDTPVTTCKAYSLPEVSGVFCLSATLAGFSIGKLTS
ncbi:UNVERIFIED_CONTAM: hypothetical protein Slati_1489500 [Sesamum latifolium]|uniref:Uncharacterized protein n=1 Tax=Sesamum latifolium TaxID=2727402 RepID=A0AAW2X6S2_9LAMI